MAPEPTKAAVLVNNPTRMSMPATSSVTPGIDGPGEQEPKHDAVQAQRLEDVGVQPDFKGLRNTANV
jgi:hypothetical protein